jgi:RNA polymerase I-specific transcription initiation factor RRN3
MPAWSLPAAGQGNQVWGTLLAAFERAVLHTHRSKFTQFLLFHACRQEPQRSTALARLLLSRLQDARQPPVTRAACAAYLASFLARSAFVSEALVVEVLQRLADACAAYAASSAATTPSRPMSRSASGLLQYGAAAGDAATAARSGTAALAPAHQVFYAMMQALLYILCYHMEPLLTQRPQHPGSKPEHAAAVTLLVQQRLVPLFSHKLAPLAVCLPSVSVEFAKQAAALRLANLSHLLPASAAGSAPSSSAAVRAPVRPLEMFFPFDPYLLARSGRFLDLEHAYVRWRGGHPHVQPQDSADGAAGGSSALAGESSDADDASEDGPGVLLLGGSSSDGGASSSSDEDDHSMRGESYQSEDAANKQLLPTRSFHRPVGHAGLPGTSLSPAGPDLMATSYMALGASPQPMSLEMGNGFRMTPS